MKYIPFNLVNPNEDFLVEYGVRDNSIELFKLEGRTRDALDAEKTGWKKQKMGEGKRLDLIRKKQ